MFTSTHEDNHAHHHLRVGDRVTVRRDVLAELGRLAAGLPPTWCCIPAGTPGRLIGWRDARAVIDLDGTAQRIVVFVGERNLARALRVPTISVERPRVNLRNHRAHRSRHRG
jgi:hypothetical protein